MNDDVSMSVVLFNTKINTEIEHYLHSFSYYMMPSTHKKKTKQHN
jgi:hypothetical protein